MKAILRPPFPFFDWVGVEGTHMHWENAEARPLPVAELGEGYRRYRLADPAAEEAMARSLHQYGQLSPLARDARTVANQVDDLWPLEQEDEDERRDAP